MKLKRKDVEVDTRYKLSAIEKVECIFLSENDYKQYNSLGVELGYLFDFFLVSWGVPVLLWTFPLGLLLPWITHFLLILPLMVLNFLKADLCFIHSVSPLPWIGLGML